MSDFKDMLLDKYINGGYLNDFEQKKFDQYVDKTNVFTYCKYEDRTHLLDENYVKWSKIKIKRINKELSKDPNLMKFLNK
jgi:hypothetical protein